MSGGEGKKKGKKNKKKGGDKYLKGEGSEGPLLESVEKEESAVGSATGAQGDREDGDGDGEKKVEVVENEKEKEKDDLFRGEWMISVISTRSRAMPGEGERGDADIPGRCARGRCCGRDDR